MRSSVRKALSVALVASGLVAAGGCSTETVTGGSADLSVVLTPNPGGTGRYEESSIIIRKILALPVDPAAAALYGTSALLFRVDPSPFTLDLTHTGDTLFSNIALAPGTYRIKEIQIEPVVLIDDTDPLPPPTNCIESIAIIDGTVPASIPDVFVISDPPNLNFTITPGQTKLSLKINIPGLISGYEASYTCTPGCGPGGAGCLTAFDQANFTSVFLANLTIE